MHFVTYWKHIRIWHLFHFISGKDNFNVACLWLWRSVKLIMKLLKILIICSRFDLSRSTVYEVVDIVCQAVISHMRSTLKNLPTTTIEGSAIPGVIGFIDGKFDKWVSCMKQQRQKLMACIPCEYWTVQSATSCHYYDIKFYLNSLFPKHSTLFSTICKLSLSSNSYTLWVFWIKRIYLKSSIQSADNTELTFDFTNGPVPSTTTKNSRVGLLSIWGLTAGAAPAE